LVEKKQGFFLNPEKNLDFQTSFFFNSKIVNINDADVCLFIGSNPRLEASIINLRIRKKYITGALKTACFGSAIDITYPISNFGSTVAGLLKFVEGKHSFCKIFSQAKKPLVIIGRSFFFNTF
jgi:NADH dehydrogenase/NADH:ubiquinone oxidoreductase subunit G